MDGVPSGPHRPLDAVILSAVLDSNLRRQPTSSTGFPSSTLGSYALASFCHSYPLS